MFIWMAGLDFIASYHFQEEEFIGYLNAVNHNVMINTDSILRCTGMWPVYVLLRTLEHEHVTHTQPEYLLESSNNLMACIR
jgi:hypothetical protein